MGEVSGKEVPPMVVSILFIGAAKCKWRVMRNC